MCINPLQPSNGLHTNRFKNQNFHVLTRQLIHVFFKVFRKKGFLNKTVYVNLWVQIEFLNMFQDNFDLRSLRQWDMFSSEQFRCAISVSLHQCSILIIIYTLHLPGETGEPNQPTKKHLQESVSIR
jgi:hypothetical protein